MERAMVQADTTARADLKRMLRWIALCGAALVGLALWYISLFGPLNVVNVTATIAGVFLSVLLGCGLFSLAFYSSKSGHDDRSRDATGRGQPAR
jgi:hypothetical protein